MPSKQKYDLPAGEGHGGSKGGNTHDIAPACMVADDIGGSYGFFESWWRTG
jgi:hypothetical protein